MASLIYKEPWNNATVTPLERTKELAGKQFFTEKEAAAFEKQVVLGRNSDRRGATAETDLQFAYNNTWYDWGSKVVKTRRTSIIIDPLDGKIPPYTAKGQEMARARAAQQSHPPEGPEDFSLEDRCLVFPTAGPPMLPFTYNNNYRIVQIPGYVVILIEMIHDVRIIPIDGCPVLPPVCANGWATHVAGGRAILWSSILPTSTAGRHSALSITA
jgi:hypothetical protein